MKKTYKIQDLVDLFGITTRTLRFWEEKELISPLLRVPGKRRIYGEAVIKRIKDIQNYKDRGMSLEDIKDQVDKKDKQKKQIKNEVRIIVDSSAGIEDKNLEKYKIDILPSYIFLDGRKFIDGVNINEEDVKDLSCAEVTTESPTVEDFIYAYSEMVDEGAREIISFHPNVAYSNSLNNAKVASSRVKGVNVHIVDTCSFGQIAELLAIITRDKLNKGTKVSDVLKYLVQVVSDHSSFLVASSMLNMSSLGLVDVDFKKIVNPLFRVTMNYHPLLKMNNQVDSYEMITRANSLLDAVDDLVGQLKNMLKGTKFPMKMIGVYYTCDKRNLNELITFLKGSDIPIFWQKSNFYMAAHLGTESVAVNILYER